MVMMRDFITDSRLLFLLETIEDALGYKIHSLPMPEIHEQVAEGCSLSVVDDIFTFLCHPNHVPPKDIMCHELMHIPLYIEGFPGFAISPFLVEGYADYEVISLISNLAPHLKVWRLTEGYGFSERDRYSQNISHGLIPKIEDRDMFTECPPEFVKGGVAVFLANGFLCPCAEEIKNHLRAVAKTSYPQSIEPADAICLAYEKALSQTPKLYCDATYQVLDIIEAPKVFLLPVSPSHPQPGFLAKVFAMME